MSINTNQQNSDEDVDVLQTHQFTAGSKQVYAKQTPYGKLVNNLEYFIEQHLKGADYEYPDIALDDEENVEGRYALAYRKALDEASHGKYEGLMTLILTYVNIDPEKTENMVFDETPTPSEAEKILIAMGRKQFPELQKAGFDDVCKLWKSIGMDDVPSEFLPPQNRNMKDALHALRERLHSMMIRSGGLLNPTAGKEGVKLCYAMMELEKRLSESMKQVSHPDMTMMDRLKVDYVKKELEN